MDYPCRDVLLSMERRTEVDRDMKESVKWVCKYSEFRLRDGSKR